MQPIENEEGEPGYENEDGEEYPIYEMTVELEKGKTESIKIYPNSQPEEVAYEFCKRQNLDFNSLEILTSKIKSLFENFQQRRPSECIMEVDEEDGQVSDHRGLTNSTHRFETARTRMDSQIQYNNNFNSSEREEEKNNHTNIEPISNINNSQEEEKDNTSVEPNPTTKYISPSQNGSNTSFFSFEKFYNEFREKILEKKNKHNTTSFMGNSKHTINSDAKSVCPLNRTRTGGRDILSKRKNFDMTIARNSELLKKFFNKCPCLDEIYQNKINDFPAFSSPVKDKEVQLVIKEAKSPGIAEIVSSEEKSQSTTSVIKPKSSSSGRIYRSNACGERLYKEGIEKRQKVDSKMLALKHNLLAKEKNEYTYKPLINHISQNEIRRKMFTARRSSRNKSYDKYTYRKINSQNNSTARQKNQRGKSVEKLSGVTANKEERREDIIFNKRKEDTFRKIFLLLDSDNDNAISILNMDTKRVPSTILSIFQPIIDEIRVKNKEVCLDEFLEACNKLFDHIQFNDKRALINFGANL